MNVPATALVTPPPPFLLAGDLPWSDLRADFSARTYPVNLAGLGIEQQSAAAIVSGATKTASSLALAIMGPAAAAGPVGLAIGAAALAITALSGTIGHLISGCGQVCVNATNIVNQEDTLIQQIVAAYWSTPTRTASFQAWTLQQLDSLFTQTVNMLQPLGSVGAESIKERLTRGYDSPWCVSNHLAVGVNNVVAPSITNPLGRCGGWYDVYYDPIANDPDVVPDASVAASVASDIGLTSSTGTLNWGMVALLGVGLVLLMTYAL
jgi:hypothetical protein